MCNIRLSGFFFNSGNKLFKRRQKRPRNLYSFLRINWIDIRQAHSALNRRRRCCTVPAESERNGKLIVQRTSAAFSVQYPVDLIARVHVDLSPRACFFFLHPSLLPVRTPKKSGFVCLSCVYTISGYPPDLGRDRCPPMDLEAAGVR